MLSPTPTFPVAIRIRPRLPGEEGKPLAITEQSGEVRVVDGSHYFTSSYKSVFTPSHTQQDVFSFVSPYISKVKKGYSTAVLAYGETGSGKTYTMLGPDWEDPVTCGIIPRALKQLYEDLAPNIGQGRYYTIVASYVLIYNEKLYDLMHPLNEQEPLRIWDDPQCGLLIEEITDTSVPSLSSCLAVLRLGELNRGSPGVSIPSHKAHSIFHLRIGNGKPCPHERLHRMKVDFCDLAGSEKDSNDIESMKVSIENFSRVISVLNSGHESAYVPYQESKLTKLLQHALHPCSNTCLIATVAPVQEAIENTIDTLKCAEKVGRVPLNPRKKTIFIDAGTLETLKTELESLRNSLPDSSPNTLEEFQDRVLRNGLTVRETERLFQFKGISANPGLSKAAKPSKMPSSEGLLEEIQRQDSRHHKGRSLDASGDESFGLHTKGKKKSDFAVAETPPIIQEPSPVKTINVKHPPAASLDSVSSIPSLSSSQGSRLEVPSTARVQMYTESGESSINLNSYLDQLVTNQARSKNEKRTRNLIEAKQAVSTFNRRRQNAAIDERSLSECMKEEDPKVLEKRQIRITAELKKLEEEKDQAKKRFDQRITKDRLELETFRKRLERKPLIEPRPLRPRGAVDKFARLLNNGI